MSSHFWCQAKDFARIYIFYQVWSTNVYIATLCGCQMWIFMLEWLKIHCHQAKKAPTITKYKPNRFTCATCLYFLAIKFSQRCRQIFHLFLSEIYLQSDPLLPSTHLRVHFQEFYLPFLWQTHMKDHTQSVMLSVYSTPTSNISVTVPLGLQLSIY